MEDFSFPAVAADPDPLCHLPFPHFAASPLWFLSSVSQPKSPRQRRSFSSAEDAYGGRSDGEEEHGCLGRRQLGSPALSDGDRNQRFCEDEKMDMLWEDFNEELTRLSHQRRQVPEESGGGGGGAKRPGSAAPGLGSRSRKGSRRSKMGHPRSGFTAIAMSKSSSVIQHGRPGLAVMLKLLKRLFLLQNPRSSRKTRHFDEQDQDAPAS